MKIEEGKFYRTRAGHKVGPMKLGAKRDKWPGDYWLVDTIWELTWWESGLASP